jgi:2,3-diaminopropionate biosynthesis protein SbnA
MVLLENTLDTIGNTPMVRLERLFPDKNVYAKIEGNNLTGSMKARSALGMINAAEDRGELKPGMTIVESTSGNLGYALAAIGSLKGYEVVLVVDPKTDELKRNILEAYGATLETVDKPDERGAYQQARIERVKQLIDSIPNSWWPCQYSNPDNMNAHYKTTGPEIYKDLKGKVDVLVGSIGTCGHLGGSAKFLLEKNPDLRVIGVEPEGSIISGGNYNPYLTQGPGLSFVPENYDDKIIKEIMKVNDADAFHFAKELAKKEAILSGGSAGSLIYTIKNIQNQIPSDKNIVAILADDGFRYASNFYDDNWMTTRALRPKDRGFMKDTEDNESF